MRRFLARLNTFIRPARAEREMAREMEAHLNLLRDDFERRGLSPSEADLAARREYGGIELAKDRHRDERSFRVLEETRRDVRLAVRALAHSPGFTICAVLTLALGAGVNTTLFTTYNAVALKPLPVSDPSTVVRLERWFDSNKRGNVQYAFSLPEYVYCRDHNRAFAGLVAFSWPFPAAASVAQGQLTGQLVASDYFTNLGITLEFGRGFRTDEANPAIVLSHSAWRRHFLSDPGILGRSVTLNGVSYAVIGVTPEAFSGTLDTPQVPDFWALLDGQPRLVLGQDWREEPRRAALQILGTLRAGMPRARAEAEAALLIRQFDAEFPQTDDTRAVTLQRTALFGNTEDPRFRALVAAVMLVVGLVLVVACANIANMLLARGASRQREIAIRLAMGAGRGRVIRQLLTESVLLALLGGLAGLAISIWSSGPLWRQIEPFVNPPGSSVTFQVDLSPDIRVLAYVLAISVATGILFGLSPALQFTRTDLSRALKDEGTAFHRRLSRSRLRSLLIGAQVAISAMLIVTAGFLTRGLLRSAQATPGFETRQVYLLFGDPGRAHHRLVDRLRLVPQVRNASFGGRPLMGTWTPPIQVASPDAVRRGRTLASSASENYFATLGIPLLRGREITRQDIDGKAQVAVISESAAREFWPDSDPIGRRFSLDMDFRGAMADFQVVGIAKDVRFANLTRNDPAHVYLCATGDGYSNDGILLRLDGDPHRALAGIRNAVESVEGNLAPGLLPISLEEGPVRFHRIMSSASATFALLLAALALSLASVGIYGVMAYVVSCREREVGIRMALGASPGVVLRSVVLGALRPVLVGMLIGFGLAAAACSTVHASLVFPASMDPFYGVPYYDPATLIGVALFVAAVAATASFVPARRAIRIQPAAALRHE